MLVEIILKTLVWRSILNKLICVVVKRDCRAAMLVKKIQQSTNSRDVSQAALGLASTQSLT